MQFLHTFSPLSPIHLGLKSRVFLISSFMKIYLLLQVIPLLRKTVIIFFSYHLYNHYCNSHLIVVIVIIIITIIINLLFTMHKIRDLPETISLVNVTKPAAEDLVTFTEDILSERLLFYLFMFLLFTLYSQ